MRLPRQLSTLALTAMFRVPAARALSSPASSLLSPALRRTQALRPAAFLAPTSQVRKQHAVSNPTLANIEKRWEAMPPQEQAELWMALRDRMTVDWHELTMQEKKACKFLPKSSRFVVTRALAGPTGHAVRDFYITCPMDCFPLPQSID